MIEGPSDGPMREQAHERWLPVLLVLFVGSGCAALIYEVVWFQLLQLVIGSSAVSLGVLLGTFMGGMCLGSLLLPRVVSARRHPLRVYALLEIGIGVVGLALLLFVPLVGRLYTAWAGQGVAGFLARGVVGGGVPAAAHDADGRDAAGRVALGRDHPARRVVAGILLRRQHRRGRPRLAAGRLLPPARLRRGHCHLRRSRRNGLVALVAFALASADRSPARGAASTESRRDGRRSARHRGGVRRDRPVGLQRAGGRGDLDAAARRLLFGGTVYTFSIILAVFLVGLGIGSGAGSMLARDPRAPARGAGLVPGAAGRRDGLGGLMLAESLPYWPINPSISSERLVQLPARYRPVRSGPCCPAPSSGAPASRWPWRRQRPGDRIRDGSSAACTPPTPSARSSARWPPAWC